MADVVATIGADSTQLQAGLSKARGMVNGWAAGVSKTAGGALGGFLGGAALIGTSKAIIDNFANVAKEAKKTGLGTDEVQQLQVEAEQADASLGQVLASLRKFQTFAGTDEQAEAFEKLGMNLDEIKKKTPIEQFQAFAKVIAAAGNEQDQLKALGIVLGDTKGKFQDLIPLFQKVATQGLEPVTKATAETVAAMAALDDQLAALKNEATVGLAPALLKVVQIFMLLFNAVRVVTDSLGSLIGGITAAGASLVDFFKALAEMDSEGIKKSADAVEKAFSDAYKNAGKSGEIAIERVRKSFAELTGDVSTSNLSPNAPGASGETVDPFKGDYSEQKKYQTARVADLQRQIMDARSAKGPSGVSYLQSIGAGGGNSGIVMQSEKAQTALLRDLVEEMRISNETLREIEQNEGGMAP